MPKHPVPKKKTAKSKSRKRYGSFQSKVLKKLDNLVNLTDCKEDGCNAKHLNHHACPECGKYRGRQVLNVEKKSDNITKIKA